MNDKRTLFALKIQSTRQTRQVVGLILILAGLCFVLAFIGGLQYAVCQRDYPGSTVRQCLRLAR